MNLFRLKNSNSTNQKSNGRALLLVALALALFGLSPTAQALNPPPDGGYPGQNTAEGKQALFNLTTGVQNTAIGFKALFTNNTNDNTAVGWKALAASTGTNSGGEGGNTAVGSTALVNNTAGVGNTAIGWLALSANAGSDNNTAVGAGALGQNTGSSNTALGTNAGVNLTTGVNNIDIGDSVVGMADESNTIRIGASQTVTYVAGIFGQTSTNGIAVSINSDGKLGTATSSKRFKEEIKPMDKASEAILALKPVTFRYKKEIDRTGRSQFGLVAEEVEKANPDLVVRDAEGKPYTVRYEAVNAMLLNEFLKEHRKNEEQQAIIMQLKSTDAKQEATILRQQKQIEALTAGLQKVSDQLELSKAAPQMVENR